MIFIPFFFKENNMSAIDDLKSQLAKLESAAKSPDILPKSSGWFSRKLIVAIVLLGGLIFMGRENIALVLQNVTILGVTYLVVQGIHDVVTAWTEAKIRVAAIQAGKIAVPPAA